MVTFLIKTDIRTYPIRHTGINLGALLIPGLLVHTGFLLPSYGDLSESFETVTHDGCSDSGTNFIQVTEAQTLSGKVLCAWLPTIMFSRSGNTQ